MANISSRRKLYLPTMSQQHIPWLRKSTEVKVPTSQRLSQKLKTIAVIKSAEEGGMFPKRQKLTSWNGLNWNDGTTRYSLINSVDGIQNMPISKITSKIRYICYNQMRKKLKIPPHNERWKFYLGGKIHPTTIQQPQAAWSKIAPNSRNGHGKATKKRWQP